MTKKEVNDHLKHVSYPTNKRELVEACNKMADIPKEDREWFERNLPDRKYNNADEVSKALKL